MNTLTVTPKSGYYHVRDQHRAHCVMQGQRCTCGGTAAQPCVHIQAVIAYQRRKINRVSEGTTMCPICGAPVTPTDYGWRCEVSSGHYWRWRGEQSGVKAFLTQPHPNKQGAFYEQTPAERDAFLAQIHARMYRNGYTPYGGD